MDRLVVVLGTSHQVQGAENGRRNIKDPSYSVLVEKLVDTKEIDFIFEEASGLGPTTAERFALPRLGQDRYLDIDPHRDKRHEYGISVDTGSIWPIHPYDSSPAPDVANWENVHEHAKREELWLQTIKDQDFGKGLFICRFDHTLSFAFKLRSADFVVEALSYMPHHKLCTKQHLE